MKNPRTVRKLVLRAETIVQLRNLEHVRNLAPGELDLVRGGLPRASVSACAEVCPETN
ncbi:MAG TPA: hypothetical protein VFT22_00390 [Kofleriaceae bacterium]|nr:hypothetical protein [Kofleriaceae bacterium]